MFSLGLTKILGGATAVCAATAGIFFLLWLDAREDLASEREACNATILEGLLDAERTAHQAALRARERQQQQLARQNEVLREARDVAESQARKAEENADAVRAAVRELESGDDASCLAAPVPDVLVERLRNTPD